MITKSLRLELVKIRNIFTNEKNAIIKIRVITIYFDFRLVSKKKGLMSLNLNNSKLDKIIIILDRILSSKNIVTDIRHSK
jgi:hypothetical protein